MSTNSRAARSTRKADPNAQKAEPKAAKLPKALQLATASVHNALTAWGKADGAAVGALVACYVAAAVPGIELKGADVCKAAPHLTEAAGNVYAARFNAAAKAAAIIGTAATRDLIRDAADQPGKKWQNIEAALGGVRKAAKADGITKATASQVAELREKGAEAVVEKSVARKAPRGPKAPAAAKPGPVTEVKAADVPKAAEAIMAALDVQMQAITRLPVDANRKGAQTDAIKALQNAREALVKLTK